MPDSVARNTHSELTHVLQQFYGAPLRAVSRIVNAQNSMLRMPLDGCKYLAEVCLTLFLRLLLFLGITTPGFISREQAKQLESQQEELLTSQEHFRSRIEELQEEVESRNRERQRALRRLSKVKIELAAAQAGAASSAPSSSNHMKRFGSRSPLENGRSQEGYRDHPSEIEDLTREPNADLPVVGIRKSPDSIAGMSQIGLHVSAALAICCLVWLTQQDLPALEKKVAQCLMFPFGWFYLTNLTAQTLRANSALICASWFFIGFAACHAVSSFH
ncbi:hypothetical protein WJX84_000689 [Apatococcus fuscideae]|uniref:Uncharacterized protein n=1 Tax=Apatococcus fuscideae TaxID=2026836 RepID=A0AAW1TGQ1_9CHLO